MLLKMAQSFGGPNFSYVAGDVAEIPDKTAKSWIKHGLAEPADPEVKFTPEELEPETPAAEETAPVEPTEPVAPTPEPAPVEPTEPVEPTTEPDTAPAAKAKK